MASRLIAPADVSEDPHVASKPSVPLIPRDLMPFSGPWHKVHKWHRDSGKTLIHRN